MVLTAIYRVGALNLHHAVPLVMLTRDGWIVPVASAAARVS